jgi:hypothetical protein
MVIWYIFPHLDMLCHEKSGKPGQQLKVGNDGASSATADARKLASEKMAAKKNGASF